MIRLNKWRGEKRLEEGRNVIYAKRALEKGTPGSRNTCHLARKNMLNLDMKNSQILIVVMIGRAIVLHEGKQQLEMLD